MGCLKTWWSKFKISTCFSWEYKVKHKRLYIHTCTHMHNLIGYTFLNIRSRINFYIPIIVPTIFWLLSIHALFWTLYISVIHHNYSIMDVLLFPHPRCTGEKTKAQKFKSKFIVLVHGRCSIGNQAFQF